MLIKKVNEDEDALINAYRMMTQRQREMLLYGALGAIDIQHAPLRLVIDNSQRAANS